MRKNKYSFEIYKQILGKLTGYITLGIVVLLFFSLFGSISKMEEVNLKINKEKERIVELEKEKEKLMRDLEIASSEEYIEEQLRDKLGMAKEGEIVVILPDVGSVKKFAPKIDDEEQILPDPNWKKWLKLFL